jgi:hypothetical protein
MLMSALCEEMFQEENLANTHISHQQKRTGLKQHTWRFTPLHSSRRRHDTVKKTKTAAERRCVSAPASSHVAHDCCALRMHADSPEKRLPVRKMRGAYA